MELQGTLGIPPDDQPLLVSIDEQAAPARRDTVARAVSIAFGPPCLIALELLLVVPADPVTDGHPLIVPFLGALIALSCLFVLSLRRSGLVSTLDLRAREERLAPSLFASASAFTAWLLLARAGVGQVVASLALAVAVQFVLLTVITLRWKISYHAAFASTVFATAIALGLSVYVPALGIVVLLVAWSRVRLGQHSPSQVAAGLASGAVIMLAGVQL